MKFIIEAEDVKEYLETLSGREKRVAIYYYIYKLSRISDVETEKFIELRLALSKNLDKTQLEDSKKFEE